MFVTGMQERSSFRLPAYSNTLIIELRERPRYCQCSLTVTECDKLVEKNTALLVNITVYRRSASRRRKFCLDVLTRSFYFVTVVSK